jgi:outer membrane protein TolC
MNLLIKCYKRTFLLMLFLTGCCRYSDEISVERACKAEEDVERLHANINLPDHCLSLDDIIEIAISNNLDLAVRAQEYAIQRETATRAAFRMLPELNTNIDLNYRNNSPAASDQVVSKTKPPLPLTPPEVGSQQRTYQWNIGLVWNLLDFGLSYFQAQVECDRLIVAAMEYERTKQNIILNAVRLYWRAIIAKKAVDIAATQIAELSRQRLALEKLLEDQFYLSKDQLLRKLYTIYQREFQLKGFNDRTDSSDPTQGYEKEYENALLDLASLMGIVPRVDFELCEVDDFPYRVDFGEISNLENVALRNRPELYRYDAEEDASTENIYAAILQELPGIQIFREFFHDDNKFLVNKSWWLIGMHSLWDLFSIPAHYYESIIGEEGEELARRNRLVQSIAVLSQVNLSEVLYEQNLEQYLMAKRIADTLADLVDISSKEKDVGKVGGADLLQTSIEAALARINQFKIYAELQNSIEQMNNAIGLPRYYQSKD